jgi:hypothetical protein
VIISLSFYGLSFNDLGPPPMGDIVNSQKTCNKYSNTNLYNALDRLLETTSFLTHPSFSIGSRLWDFFHLKKGILKKKKSDTPENNP